MNIEVNRAHYTEIFDLNAYVELLHIIVKAFGRTSFVYTLVFQIDSGHIFW